MKSQAMRSRRAALALAVMGALGAAQANAQSDPWQYRASLYAYLPDMGGKTRFPTGSGGSGGSSVDITAEKIIDALKFTFMGTIEAHNGRWGVVSDLIYLNLGDSRSNTRDFGLDGLAPPISTTANLNLDVKGWVWTTAGQYRVASDPGFTLDLLAGVRYFDLEERLAYEVSSDIGRFSTVIREGNATNGESVWDGIIGVKGRFTLGQERRWAVPFYFDVGAGESKRTTQAAAGVAYSFSWGEASALWRYLDYRFKSGRPIERVDFNGPMLGANFRW